MPIWGFWGHFLRGGGQSACQAPSETESGKVGHRAELYCPMRVNPEPAKSENSRLFSISGSKVRGRSEPHAAAAGSGTARHSGPARCGSGGWQVTPCHGFNGRAKGAGSLLGPKNVKWTSEESTDISTSSASTASLASVFRLTLQLSHHILNGRRTRIGSDVSTPTENCLDTYLRNLAGLRRLPGEDREREQVAFRGVHLVGFGLIADSLDSCLQQQRTHHRRHRRRPPPRREIPRPRRGSIVRCATSPEPPGSVVLEEMRPILVCPDKHLGTPRSRRLSQLVMT